MNFLPLDDQYLKETIPESLATMVSFLLRRNRSLSEKIDSLEKEKKVWKEKEAGFDTVQAEQNKEIRRLTRYCQELKDERDKKRGAKKKRKSKK